jgi:hypothetical protein
MVRFLHTHTYLRVPKTFKWWFVAVTAKTCCSDSRRTIVTLKFTNTYTLSLLDFMTHPPMLRPSSPSHLPISPLELLGVWGSNLVMARQGPLAWWESPLDLPRPNSKLHICMYPTFL